MREIPDLSVVVNAHNHNTDYGEDNAGVVFPRKLFLEENSAPKHRNRTISRNYRSGKGNVLAVRKGIYVCKLSDGFKCRTDVFRSLLFGEEFVLFDEFNIDEADNTADEEGQLVSRVRSILVKIFEHKAIRKGSQSIEQAIDNGKKNCKKAL